MKWFAAEHGQHPVVGAPSLPVSRRCEAVPVGLAIVDQRIEDRRFCLIHAGDYPGVGTSTRVTASKPP